MFVTRASTSAGKQSGETHERAHTCGEGRKVNLAVLRRTTDGDHLARNHRAPAARVPPRQHQEPDAVDRKSTRLNSSHLVISYAVFCLKKKTTRDERTPR